MSNRPDDIISPGTDAVLPCKAGPEEARAAGRIPGG